MATKGYNSYRGRMSGGKIVLIVVLALVLVGALAYLALQNYVVYDEAGNATIDLPFSTGRTTVMTKRMTAPSTAPETGMTSWTRWCRSIPM